MKDNGVPQRKIKQGGREWEDRLSRDALEGLPKEVPFVPEPRHCAEAGTPSTGEQACGAGDRASTGVSASMGMSSLRSSRQASRA